MGFDGELGRDEPGVGGPLDEDVERFVRGQTLSEDVLQSEQGMRDGDGGELASARGGRISPAGPTLKNKLRR